VRERRRAHPRRSSLRSPARAGADLGRLRGCRQAAPDRSAGVRRSL